MPGKQDWMTPRELFEACERRFGYHGIDLAATPQNTKCTYWCQSETLTDFFEYLPPQAGLGRGWLNPPFCEAARFLERASNFAMPITALVLASTSTAWFRDHVCGKADVYFLTPRPRFIDGLTDAQRGKKAGGGDRDLMILDYNRSDRRRPPCAWNWKTDEITEI